MFELSENYNLSIDDRLFECYIQDIEQKDSTLTTEDLHFIILAMIGCIAIHNPYAPHVYMTLDMIIMTMAQDINFKATAKIRTGIMNGLNILKKYGVIKMSENLTGDKKQVVCISTSKLAHKTDDKTDDKTIKYFQISREELATIIKESNVPHHLITIMCNYCSRFNVLAYVSFNTWKKTYCDSGATLYKKLSCWASQNTLKHTWINTLDKQIERKNDWDVSQPQFSKYLQQLINLKIFDRIVDYKENGNTTSYYFRPIHKECVAWSLELLSKQQEYMKQSKQQDVEPIEDTEPTLPVEQPKQSKASSRGKNKEWYMD